MINGYDIIGDVHGHHDQLTVLLRNLGYREQDGAWRHSGRQAIFVGDLIDRGPHQVETVLTVRRMVDAGSARCILGNHEFNAVAWFTPDPAHPGEYLRPHAKGDNRKQHEAFLTEVEGQPLHAELVGWFQTLPLWLETDGIRVVHACWHVPSLQYLANRVSTDCSLPYQLYVDGSNRAHAAFKAIEALCKGLEVPLPDGVTFRDNAGRVRHEARIRWWAPQLDTYRQAAIGPPSLTERIPDLAFPEELRPQPYVGPPVFFGHYWFSGEPQILADNIACLDYSVANGGPLVAYRWDGEDRLTSKRLVQSR
ncbi:MAG: metallophosphoesterase [Steroidobacteraceae bacterium]